MHIQDQKALSRGNRILQLQSRAGGVFMLSSPLEIDDWLQGNADRPRGFTSTYKGFEIVAYRVSVLGDSPKWEKC